MPILCVLLVMTLCLCFLYNIVVFAEFALLLLPFGKIILNVGLVQN